jgi:hypothetical protein
MTKQSPNKLNLVSTDVNVFIIYCMYQQLELFELSAKNSKILLVTISISIHTGAANTFCNLIVGWNANTESPFAETSLVYELF